MDGRLGIDQNWLQTLCCDIWAKDKTRQSCQKKRKATLSGAALWRLWVTVVFNERRHEDGRHVGPTASESSLGASEAFGRRQLGQSDEAFCAKSVSF